MSEIIRKSLALMYHDIKVSDANLDLYDVSLDKFKSQMEYLRLNFPLLQSSEIILTFDDGYRVWAEEILEILISLHFNAYFFVCLKFLKESRISKENIVRLANNGMIIGSHGVSHTFLHRLKDADILHELSDSKKVLEDITGKEIKNFSVPRGVYNKTVLEIALEVGYERVFTSNIGLNDGSSFLMKRIALNRNTAFQQFQDICSHKGIRKMALMQCMRDGAKRIAGIDLYNKIRNALIPLTGDQ